VSTTGPVSGGIGVSAAAIAGSAASASARSGALDVGLRVGVDGVEMAVVVDVVRCSPRPGARRAYFVNFTSGAFSAPSVVAANCAFACFL
jgi:hypothetical protein